MDTMKNEDIYPNLDEICRLCLKEYKGTISIFSDQRLETIANGTNLSIPMRIMACAALEVQQNDGLPKNICTDCRYQLEKSYLFRKQSQASDAKLRKHIRLLTLGKLSKVFRKCTDDDDDEDELEFYDSLEFIKQHDEKSKLEEKLKIKTLEAKIIGEQQVKLKIYMEQLKATCKEELRAEVEESVRNDLRQELQKEIENEIVPRIRKECLQKAKISLKNELRDECRQIEKQALLDDLKSFLTDRQINCSQSPDDDMVEIQKEIQDHKIDDNKDEDGAKRKLPEESTLNIQKKLKYQEKHKEKYAHTLSDNLSDIDASANDDDDRESDNFLIYDTDEGFQIQKKSVTDSCAGDDDEDRFIEDQLQAYESSEDLKDNSNGHDNQQTSTISYRIADPESSEITFLKKSKADNDFNDDNNDEQLNDDSFMVINYPNEVDDEEHLDAIVFTNDGDNIDCSEIKTLMKDDSSKRSKPIENCNFLGKVNTFTTTTATVKTTFTTKTFASTAQRVTDTPKMFKCPECPMEFTTKLSSERHMRIHKREGSTFQCSECQIVVSCSSALRRHMYIHSEKKPFVCTECGKSFVQKEILKRHMQTHTGIKPHKCPHCDREYAQRINLKSHINRNHMEEPRIQQHSCHLCPKRFNHASGLSRHLTTHSGLAYQCSECNRTFGDRSSIKRHIATMHGHGKIAKAEHNRI